VSNDPAARSFCDALLAPAPGELTFEINRHTLSGGVSADDREVAQAMAFAFRHFKIVLEPGGAVALACVLAGKRAIADKTIGVVCSGGNVEPDVFSAVLRDQTP
jgi:threonine dehydratase